MKTHNYIYIFDMYIYIYIHFIYFWLPNHGIMGLLNLMEKKKRKQF